MKNFFFLLLAAVVLTVAVSSCSSSSTETPPTTYTPTPVHFQQGKIARYDLYLIDTPSSDGSNIDHFVPDSTKYNLEEQVVDTAFAFPLGIKATKTVFASTPPDTSYYYQDKDGNLFRYNYGFNTLNNFKDLILALGSPVDVGWVLIAKPGAPSGTTWLAKKDSMRTGGFGILYLEDHATALADTTFTVSDGQNANIKITSTHTRHIVRGYTTNGEIGTITVDNYFSPELGMTMMDFFHSSNITALNLKARGSQKVMTLYKP